MTSNFTILGHTSESLLLNHKHFSSDITDLN